MFSGVADLKKVFEKARFERLSGHKTLLFVDEIHRFNRAQQDGFLPVMEDGTVVLVGATTENPSFELNAALLSRSQVLRFKSLSADDLEALVAARRSPDGGDAAAGRGARHDPADAGRWRRAGAAGAGGGGSGVDQAGRDARHGRPATVVQRRAPIYDKAQDGHYNLISALHKTIRGSDPDAALYYFARMLDAGEDPLFLARRLIRMAVEDIGLADPQALPQAVAARDAYQMLGSPEGELALAQTVVYLALAPKSNAVYTAFKAASSVAKSTGSPMPPMVILNAPTKLMKGQGYGEGYHYDHDTPEGFSGQEYFPEAIGRQRFYEPVERGVEREIASGWTISSGCGRSKAEDKD